MAEFTAAVENYDRFMGRYAAGLAYGIILQAVEVITALVLGVPALLGEGLRLEDIRSPTRGAAPSGDEGAE